MANDSKAIKKLREMLEGGESVKSLAEKLGVARGTLTGILAGATSPRMDVVVAAKKLGIRVEDWT